MISSAIWKKNIHEWVFLGHQISSVQRTSAIWGLWKTHQCTRNHATSSYVLVSRVECIHSIVNIYHNNEQTFLRTTEVKQCVLIPKIVKITKIALYYIFLHCMPCFLHCIALKWQSSRPIRNARKRKKECRGKEECPPNSDIKINPFYHSRCDVSTG